MPRHVGHPNLPSNTMDNAEKWSATLDCPSYAIDDDTAISVVDGMVEVVSEGQWRHFDAPAPPAVDHDRPGADR